MSDLCKIVSDDKIYDGLTKITYSRPSISRTVAVVRYLLLMPCYVGLLSVCLCPIHSTTSPIRVVKSEKVHVFASKKRS